MSNADGYDAALARVDEVVERAVEQGQAPGVVAAVARGEVVHVAAAGVMAVGGAPLRRDTLFRISSMTKPMTAAAVLSLVDDGLLELHGPVDELLPELAGRRVLRSPDGPLGQTVPARRPVTVRDLLTFTWGFGMQGAMFMAAEPWPIFTAALERELSTFGPPQPGAMPDPDTWMARLGELPLLAQPGERWLYQSGSQVLGVLAARAASAPFEDVLRERVLGPLGMKDTGFHATDTARLPAAYENRDGLLVVSDPPDGQWSRPPLFPDGSGGLVSSADDVIAFGRMLMRAARRGRNRDACRLRRRAVRRARLWLTRPLARRRDVPILRNPQPERCSPEGVPAPPGRHSFWRTRRTACRAPAGATIGGSSTTYRTADIRGRRGEGWATLGSRLTSCHLAAGWR